MDVNVENIDLDPIAAFVLGFFNRHQITVLCDGRIQRPGDLVAAKSLDDLPECLTHIDTDDMWLMDELLSEAKTHELSLSEALAKRTLRRVSRPLQAQRRRNILEPLFKQLNSKEAAKAEANWKHLADTCFKEEAGVTIAVLKHFMFQVKQKSSKAPVARHLMPIIYNELQGSGKTYFARRLLEPLQELCPAPVLLSDLADARSLGVFGYAALLVDDMEHLRAEQVPRLKAMLTNDDLTRRKLGTSSVNQNRQKATLIGTSNIRVERQIPDDTGHRRFFTLTFRDGEKERDGDPKVWKVVREIDFLLLWQSVNAFGKAPIDSVLPQIMKAQEAYSSHNVVQKWLYNLNLSSHELRVINRFEGIQVADLYSLFKEQNNSPISQKKFETLMATITRQPDSPLTKDRTNSVRFYRVNDAKSAVE